MWILDDFLAIVTFTVFASLAVGCGSLAESRPLLRGPAVMCLAIAVGAVGIFTDTDLLKWLGVLGLATGVAIAAYYTIRRRRATR